MLTVSSPGKREDHGRPGPTAGESPSPAWKLNALRAAAILGFAVPTAMLALHVSAEGAAPADYFGAWVETLPSAQLLADLAITSLVFIGWAAIDGRRHGVRWWVTIPATLLVGICFAVPLYLLLRERVIDAGSDAGSAVASSGGVRYA